MKSALVGKAGTLGFLALCTITFGSGCGGRQGPGAATGGEEGEHTLIGAPAPTFELPSRSGDGKVALAEGSGKVVIVDFWATWCEPCRDSFPVYQRMVDKFDGKLIVIGVSVDEEPDGIEKFAADTGAKFDLVWDEGQVLSERYKPPTMPTSYIVDKNGVVRFVHAGFKSGDDAKIESEVSSLVD
jgi:cytochrome c biogenesis protein CcmG, thiol:disulfide interchange protein DsbE